MHEISLHKQDLSRIRAERSDLKEHIKLLEQDQLYAEERNNELKRANEVLANKLVQAQSSDKLSSSLNISTIKQDVASSQQSSPDQQQTQAFRTYKPSFHLTNPSFQRAPTSSSSSNTSSFISAALNASMQQSKPVQAQSSALQPSSLFATATPADPYKPTCAFAKANANASTSFIFAKGCTQQHSSHKMEMEANPTYTDAEKTFGDKVILWLLGKLETEDKVSLKTKNQIKGDIDLYKALKENPDASPEAITAAQKLLLKLKEYTFLLQGGKAMIKSGETQTDSAMLGYEFPTVPIRPYVKVVMPSAKGRGGKSSRGGSSKGSNGKSRRGK